MGSHNGPRAVDDWRKRCQWLEYRVTKLEKELEEIGATLLTILDDGR